MALSVRDAPGWAKVSYSVAIGTVVGIDPSWLLGRVIEVFGRGVHRRFASLPFSTADAATIEAGDLDGPYTLLEKVIEAFNRDDLTLANALLARLNHLFGCLPSERVGTAEAGPVAIIEQRPSMLALDALDAVIQDKLDVVELDAQRVLGLRDATARDEAAD